MRTEANPTVLLSYSQDSEEHRRRVLELAQQLRAHGIDAAIDQFINGSPEEGWPAWMMKRVQTSDFVLIVCTPAYRTRFEGDEIPGRGLGVTWEAVLTQQELYEAQGRNKKFIPVVFGSEPLDSVPLLLRRYQTYRLMDQYTALLRVLLDQPGVVPAPLAAPVRLAGDARGPSALAAAPGLPLPLAQTLLRCINAKSPAAALLAAHYFFEAVLQLGAAAQIALYTRYGPASPPIDELLGPAHWSSAAQWLEILRRISGHSSAARSEALAVMGDVGARLSLAREWNAAGEFMQSIAGPAGPASYSALEILAAIERQRSAPEDRPETAQRLRDAILEILRVVQPFGDCHLAVGTYITGDTGGAHAYQYLSLHGDGLRLPLAVNAGRRESGRPRESDLWWVGDSEPLPLAPFVVFESRAGVPERCGFLHPAASASAAASSSEAGVRCQLTYLDYQSGDYLQQRDAEVETGQFLGTLWGRAVSPSEVRSLAARQPEGRPPAAPDAAQWVGDFQILGELGRGAMGVVYKARQGSLGRIVALKLLPSGGAGDSLAVRRFLLEIEALGRCDHPNVVKVLTAGREGDRPFYAMEFVDGSDLAHVYTVLNGWHQSHRGHLTEGHLRGAISSSGAAAPAHSEPTAPAVPVLDEPAFRKMAAGKDYYRRLAEIMADAALGVQHLHDHHILHRDLKPSNLMLTSDGRRAVVMDLGLAKATDAASLTGSTQIQVLGTLRYMAPEQLQRKLIPLTPQADIYALGATLYELACLAPMFDADTEERLAAQVLLEEPADPVKRNPELPRPLALIITKATAKVPAARYASAAEMAEDLESFARDGFTIHAKPPSLVRRARRYTVAHKAPVAGAALVSLALACAGWWWDFNRLKTYSYADDLEVRQVPAGASRISASQARRMGSHAELQFRRGKVVTLRWVNSAGKLLDGDEAEWHFHYRQDGSLESIEGFDHNHILKRVQTVSQYAGIVEFKNKAGAAMTSRLETGDATSGGSEITRQAVEYDALGHEHIVRFQNSFGKPEPGADGHYGIEIERDATGFAVRRWELDVNGRRKASINGIYETRYERDRWGHPLRICYLTQSGEPAILPAGFSCELIERDAVGNPTLVWRLGPGGNRVLGKDGCAGIRHIYDENGFEREQTCLSAQGAPLADTSGVAIRKYLRDRDGNLIEGRDFGPDGKPTYHKQGIAVYTRRYDQDGNLIGSAYFGVDGRPVTDEHGHHRIAMVYANGRLVREEQYGVDGRLVRTKAAMPITTHAYDERGNEIEWRVFDEAGQPANDEDGTHRVWARYDERGNRIERIFYDNRGKRVTIPRVGYAGFTATYDSQGRMTGEAFFGPDGGPAVIPAGYQHLTRAYNDSGELVEEGYFGPGNEPALRDKSFHRVTLAYNDVGQTTSVAYFGVDGKTPAASADGIHRRTRKYDARGNLVEEANFGTSGQPALTRRGYHILRKRYDDWNRTTEWSYWGVGQEPVLIAPLRIHRLAEKYDARGNVIEEDYFDATGKPCATTEGYQRIVKRYDDRGFEIEQSYFGPENQKVIAKTGEHRRVDAYDARGNVIEQRFYGPDDKLTIASGRAIVRVRYDVHGNELEVAYYGKHNELVRRNDQPIDPSTPADFKRRNGAARVVYTYDDGNRRTLEEFFGPDNRPTENVFGTARVRFLYGPGGKRVEKWYRLNGAEIPAKFLEPPAE